MAGHRGKQFIRIIGIGFLLALAFAVPVLYVHLNAPEPQTRRIHIEHFRYGMDPEVIHVNRGDTLILTFDSRDTTHSFMLQEYDFDAKVMPQRDYVEVLSVSDPEADPVKRSEVVIDIGRSGLMGFLNTKCRFRCHAWCGDMHAFEQGFLIIHPNYLHAGANGVLTALIGLTVFGLARRKSGAPLAAAPEATGELSLVQLESPEAEAGVNLFKKWPWLRTLFVSPTLQNFIIALLAGGMYIVIILCLIGTKMAGGNLGVMLVWIVWLTALIVIFVPLGGRAWCAVCPIPLFGDLLQRGATPTTTDQGDGRFNTRFRGLNLRWPKLLSNETPRVIMFLGFGTVSTLIVSQPRWTGWAIVLLIVLATTLPLVFELRTFCRWLCPINSFISLYSSMGRLSLRSNKKVVCEKCKERGLETCRKGNDHGFACPYGLTVSQLDRNNECGLCMECVRSCSFENIALRFNRFGLHRLLDTAPQAWQAIVMLTLAIVYHLTFQGPWHALRDMVNIVDKNNYREFAIYSASLWLLALGLMPLIFIAAARLATMLSGARQSAWTMFIRDASSLVPFGLMLWIAFSIPMFTVNGTFILSSLSDPFGWGWDLFGHAGQPWWQLAPELTAWIQCGLLLIGFATALRINDRVWRHACGDHGRPLLGTLPMRIVLVALTCFMLWFFAG